MFRGIIKLIVFFSSLYYLFGGRVVLVVFILYLCLPFVILNGKIRRHAMFMHKVQTPFLNLKNVSNFGILGGRSLTIKHHSTIDNQDIELGVWHILPQSLIEKLEALNDDPEEMSSFFVDQLKYSRKPVIIYSHGITQSVGEPHRVSLYKILQKLDCHVVTFDYRGFGISTSILPSRMGLVEDFLAVYCWVNQVCGDSPMFVWGHSLGSGIANKALSKLDEFSTTLLKTQKTPALPRGLILESGYNQVAHSAVKFGQLDWLLLLPYCKIIVKHYWSTDNNLRLNSEKYVTSLKSVPLLIMHARDDTIIPIELSEKLYEAAKSTRSENDAPVWFEEFAKGYHMWICNEEKLPTIVNDFIRLCTLLLH